MENEIKKLNPPDSWDKEKVYFSPSGEQIAVFVTNQWVNYIRSDVVGWHIKDAIKADHEQRKAQQKEPPLVIPKWVEDWNSSGSDKYPI